ncbi:CRISPR-associated endonuclease Cas2 [Nautilia lithotrophica]
MYYVVAYDITDDKRRKKVSELLEGYGIRVNFSVFEMDVSVKELNTIKRELKKIVSKKYDSVRFYHICKSCESKSFDLTKNSKVFDLIGGFF